MLGASGYRREAIRHLRTGVDRLHRRLFSAASTARHDRPDSALAGLPFDDVELESNLVWIVGSPRTGSTWVLEQLCDPLRLDEFHSPGFRLPNEADAPLDALPVNEFRIGSHIAPAFGEPVEAGGELVPPTLNNYLGHKPAYLFSREFEEVWRPALRRFVLVRLYGVQAEAARIGLPLAASPSLVVKEVNGSDVSDVLMSLFPRSRLLFLVRDGRDVVDSLIHALGKGGWLAEHDGQAKFDTTEERLAWMRKACRDWACGIDASRRAYASHAPALRFMLRYEDLIEDPRRALEHLFRWAGLERSTERINRIVNEHAFAAIPEERRGSRRRLRAATPGLWRENLGAAEQSVAEEVMGTRLAELGYPE